MMTNTLLSFDRRLGVLAALGGAGRAMVFALVSLLAAPAALAQATAANPGWYASVALGRALQVSDTQASVDLAAAPVAVRLDGRTAYGGGNTVSAAVGKEFVQQPAKAGEQPNPWRLEGEFWRASVKRESFRAGQLDARLGDSVQAQGVFVNGLMRVAATQDTRWWLGAGVGYVRVSMPDANAQVPSCKCLADASGSGAAVKVKAAGEWKMSADGALFAELSMTNLSGSVQTQAGKLPYTSHQPTRVTAVSVGYRVSF